MVLQKRSKSPVVLTRRIRIYFLIGIILISILASIAYVSPAKKSLQKPIQPTPAVVIGEQAASKTVTYSGKEGVDALTLLKEHAAITLDRSGVVSGINGEEAQPNKKEFWSFFINGKMAKVGPASYIAKDTDQLEWKIQTY